MNVWQELKRRKVLRVGGAYVVIAWVLIQVAALLEETLELPGWFDKAAFAALVLGFPIALLLSWAFDLQHDDKSSQVDTGASRSLPIALFLAISLGSIGAAFFVLRDDTPAPEVTAISPSIAVLPFADLSPEGNQAWFADGVSEEILNVLAKTEGLQVASRTASFRYRGDDVNISTIAAELDVATILEGSVRSQGDQLRITAQLIDSDDGFHLWSETYDRQLTDIFVVQDEIAVSIATALFGELGVEALPERRFDGTRNVDAYSSYLRGMEILNTYEFRFATEAVDHFTRSIELDPEFAAAWAGLARAQTIRDIYASLEPAISPALKRAVTLDPDNADAVAELAYINGMQLNWLEAEQLFLRAIELQPDNARIRINFGEFLRRSGRISRALEQFQSAWNLGSGYEELGSLIVNTHAYLGEFAEARAFFEAWVADVGLENVSGNTAYFVALLESVGEVEARSFADRYLAIAKNPLARGYVEFFLGRLDGDPNVGARLTEVALARIERTGFPRSGDIEALLIAGATDLAREHAPNIWGAGWGAPRRISLFVDDEIDPRYLPYRGNLLLILDVYEGVPEAFETIGVDLTGLAREKGFIE